ncbi:hypothetical protein EUX98_g5651 [Antrodiella citrinella]|uniref:Pinin/SDK/MemA protein domain-containing protein n=1 Tax=Antrodiella citrinella TaxID=2447956 RepID=A0A4S4MT41_9APHY|nr:hypothetical protein EUX98_g5651 [Antrodiella citrinella]
MSTEEPQPTTSAADEDAAMSSTTFAPPTAPAAMATANRKRPRLDLTVDKDASGRERKRGKSMFGLLVGTLNKAKVEDNQRNKSEAAKKRQLIDQRLQDRLREETDSVRRQEEAKKDKTFANRKEEELQLRDSLHKLRRTRLPLLANFLSTADHIPPIPSSEDSSDEPASSSSTDPLKPLAKSHPPPLYYLPAILTPAQEAFLMKRKAEVTEAAEKEWLAFREERTYGVAEILKLRERVAEEDARKKTEQQSRKEPQDATNGDDVKMGDGVDVSEKKDEDGDGNKDEKAAKVKEEAGMDVDDDAKPTPVPAAKPEEKTVKAETKVTPVVQPKREAMQTDEDDAVEY